MTHLRRLSVALLGVALALWLGGAVPVPLRAATQLRVVLLVDSSTSMATFLTEFRKGLNAFIDDLPEDVEVALVSTGGQFRLRVPPTTDRARLHDAASRFASDGGANSFLETMLESDKRILKSAPDRRPVIVVLTTDAPALHELRIDAYNEFMRDFMRRDGRGHAIVIRGTQFGPASEILSNLTQNTGGMFTTMSVASSLATRMKDIAAQVAAQQ